MNVSAAHMEKLILENQWLTVWDLFAVVESSFGIVHNIAHEYGLPVCNQWNFYTLGHGGINASVFLGIMLENNDRSVE
jgi:alcohol dehydrogenase class IV